MYNHLLKRLVLSFFLSHLSISCWSFEIPNVKSANEMREVPDTVKGKIFKRKFNYLYDKKWHLRFTYSLSRENYELVLDGDTQKIPSVDYQVFSLALDFSGTSQFVIFPTIFFSYQRSLNEIDLLEEHYNIASLGITLATLKILRSRIALEFYTDQSIYAWTKSKKFHHMFTLGGTFRYNFYNNFSLECSLFNRDGCYDLEECPNKSLKKNSIHFSIGVALNI